MNVSAPFRSVNSYSKMATNMFEYFDEVNFDYNFIDTSDKYFLKKTCTDINYNGREVEFMAGKNFLLTNLSNLSGYESDSSIPIVSTSFSYLPKSVLKKISGKKVIALNEFTEKSIKNSGFNGSIDRISVFNNMNAFRRAGFFEKYATDQVVFLTICDFNHPNWGQEIKCYYKAFKSVDNVKMVVLVRSNSWNRYYQANIIRKIREIKNSMKGDLPDLDFIGSEMRDSDLMKMFNSCDCFVKLYGGTGLSHLDAMSSNMVSIGPETGPCSEFLTNDNSFLISKERESRFSSKNEFNGIPYDVYSSEQLMHTMKHVYSNYESVKENLFKERRITTSKFDRSVVVPRLISLYKNV